MFKISKFSCENNVLITKGRPARIKDIVEYVAGRFGTILNEDVYRRGVDKRTIKERVEEKNKIRQALKKCTFGDSEAKELIKEHIKDILLKDVLIDKDNIDGIFNFNNSFHLDGKSQQQTSGDRFDIILYIYKKDYGRDALSKFIDDFSLDRGRYNDNGDCYYEINCEDIDNAYNNMSVYIPNFVDKLNILVQRIYQLYKGNGVIDEIRDMHIDGVSGGVSGIPADSVSNGDNMDKLPKSYESVWIFFRGKSIHLSFLSFGSEKELIRVCKNIYKFNNPGQLSQATGFIVNEMQDGSRVSVARPPFCEGWVFFVRKFDSIRWQDMESLITDKGSENVIYLIRSLIKGCRVVGITGEQGSGKTTLLMSMISFISPTYNLRIQELSFELHLRKKYPDRNIVTFRETNTVSGQEGLNYQKKTEGTVNILGEVASAPVANWLIQMAQVGSLFTLFTHHAKTTKDLVISMRNALLMEGGFNNEVIATEQVADALDFDIHMRKDINGHRYIERITEIIPIKENKDNLTNNMFVTRDIIVYEDGMYRQVNTISRNKVVPMLEYMSLEEKEEFVRRFAYG